MTSLVAVLSPVSFYCQSPWLFDSRGRTRTLSIVGIIALLGMNYRISQSQLLEGGGGGHWLVWMEWRPARWSVCLPLLVFPCTIKFRSSVLAPAHLGGPRKRAVKRLWWCWWLVTTAMCASMLMQFVYGMETVLIIPLREKL